MTANLLERPTLTSRADWLTARRELLNREKQLTRLRDEIDQQLRALPWVQVEKTYTFDGPDGQRTLSGLVDAGGLFVPAPSTAADRHCAKVTTLEPTGSTISRSTHG